MCLCISANLGCSMFSKALCKFGYDCQGSGSSSNCVSRCNETVCGQNGDCYFGSDETTHCK